MMKLANVLHPAISIFETIFLMKELRDWKRIQGKKHLSLRWNFTVLKQFEAVLIQGSRMV